VTRTLTPLTTFGPAVTFTEMRSGFPSTRTSFGVTVSA
jgi:hypothetical protein